MIDILLTDQSLSVNQTALWRHFSNAGGSCVFVGSVRDETKGRRVIALEFEAYKPMAESEMQKIAEDALNRWSLLGIAIHHRTGRLEIGELPVVITAVAPHRAAAFEACRYCIDTLKETVPIWKKEIFEDGEVWVAAHP